MKRFFARAYWWPRHIKRPFLRQGPRAPHPASHQLSRLPRWFRIASPAIFGVFAALLLIHFINGALRPVMTALAEVQVGNEISSVIDGVVLREVDSGEVAYDSMITLEKDANGAVSALKSNMAQANILRARILSATISAVGEVDNRTLGIPLGNLFGVDLFSGRGPDIPVRVLTAGTASAAFENVFSSAGINQTRHQIMLNVAVPVSILLPGFTTTTEISTQLCVAETVIVGQVPENYTYFSQFDTADEAAQQHFNFRADTNNTKDNQEG